MELEKKTVSQDYYREIQKRLQEPFPDEDIEWRVQRCGNKNGRKWAMILPYVTNRAIQSRLDDVFGINGWQNEYRPAPNGGVLCGISFYDKEKGQWITKWDGADNTNIEAVKGGLSSAMKRAAVQLGIGRWLYSLDAVYVDVVDHKTAGVKNYYVNDVKQNVRGYWVPPTLNPEPLQKTKAGKSTGGTPPSKKYVSSTGEDDGSDGLPF